MAKLYKVWANCCAKPKGMRVQETYDVEREILLVVHNAAESGLISVIDKTGEFNHDRHNKYISMAKAYFDETKYLECGDYCIMEVDDNFDVANIEIPNSCGWSGIMIFSEAEKCTGCYSEKQKSSYKDAKKIDLGMSDIASLTLRAPDKAEILKFGGDSAYTAYFLDEDEAEYEIGEHYTEVFSCENWLKTYDDDILTNKIYAKTIKIYRAGDYGCIIAASGIDYANTLLETM